MRTGDSNQPSLGGVQKVPNVNTAKRAKREEIQSGGIGESEDPLGIHGRYKHWRAIERTERVGLIYRVRNVPSFAIVVGLPSEKE